VSEKQSEKKTGTKTSSRTAPEGDPTAEPGTQEHLGSDRPYEGADAPSTAKEQEASGRS
jgi:hypothetical protein